MFGTCFWFDLEEAENTLFVRKIGCKFRCSLYKVSLEFVSMHTFNTNIKNFLSVIVLVLFKDFAQILPFSVRKTPLLTKSASIL